MLDTSFLIDYHDGHPAAQAYFEAHDDHEFVIPSTVYTEYLLGGANLSERDLTAAREEIAWTQRRTVTEQTADRACDMIAQLPADAPHLTGIDATVIGVALEVGAPLVSVDSDLTHDRVKEHPAIEVDEYR